MNVKFSALIGVALGMFAFLAIAQPARADVSIEIISRLNSVRSLNAGTGTQSSFQPTSTGNEANEQGDGVQNQADISLETEPDSLEPSEDDFEGLLIRI